MPKAKEDYDITPIRKRLREYLAYESLNNKRFEEKCGLYNGFVRALDSKITFESLAKISAQCTNLNLGWLFSGEGSMLNGGESRRIEPEESSLPLIPFEAVAGPGSPVYEDERIESFYQVSEFRDCDFLIRVKGDSMSPHFTGGDLLACKKVVDAFFFQWGRCYVLLTRSQGAMVKRIQPSERDGWIKCVSDNEKYAPFDVPMEDVISVALVNGSISLE
jgi:phage repressor protein C with HTH and peptisase S24 domain